MSFFRKLITKSFQRLVSNTTQGKNVKPRNSIKLYPGKIFKSNETFHHIKYVLIFASGYLSYKIYKENLSVVPNVSAASIFNRDTNTDGLPLAGRRKQFNFIADVVETSAPAVVYIEIKDSRRVDFFTGRPMTISNGSGFIIEENGLILTNAHVVTNKPNAKVEVRLVNGKIYNGVVEDIDMKSDLATVRIKANNLPVMKLGMAIGSPLALSNTVTSGVVSSTSRGSDELGLTGKDMVYIQTDAAITFGNSGGPLVNLDGEAIGINSMKVTAGISFAIPIDYVKIFLRATKTHRKADTDTPKRLYMGITMLTLTPQIIHELQQRNHIIPRDVQGGVLVWKVILGSPAHIAGLQPGDIVTHVDGKPIKHSNEIYSILTNTKCRTLKMSVSRHGKNIELEVTPEDLG
ncbi:hypothetical protein NQ317_018660 [Molorchus minor]|uniref:Serine protease HTRA2, mitochondrial n=1 Tax=Molorchus minor TaxID=1323400 RepID=A0ABQ9IWE9_9CUCU|nr:hypothetical protein NQ317_018660 [Molorchus minor]